MHCSQYGTEIGWLIDPEEETILIVDREQRVKLLRENDTLPLLPEIQLSLTVAQVMAWLTFGQT